MESIHEHNLLLETYEHPNPTLRRHDGLNVRVEEFPPISHFHSVRTTTLSRRDANKIQGKSFGFLTSSCFFHVSEVMFQFLITSLWRDFHLRVAFKSPRVKELWPGPIRLPRCEAGAK